MADHKKEDFVKHWKKICGISIIVILMAAVCLLFAAQEEDRKINIEESSVPKGNVDISLSQQITMIDIQEELQDRLSSFAQVLYQYDTAERKFYEGAEEYMTQQAYGKLYPMSAQEEDGQAAIRVRSTLMDVNIYAFYESSIKAAVILESQFSLSQGTNGSLTQYLKLTLERQKGVWMITECQIIDTLEE